MLLSPTKIVQSKAKIGEEPKKGDGGRTLRGEETGEEGPKGPEKEEMERTETEEGEGINYGMQKGAEIG